MTAGLDLNAVATEVQNVRRVVRVGHRLLLERELAAGRGPVQVEDRVDPVRVEI